MKYIFDVDGTLTPSRKKMDGNFALWFSDFCLKNEVYLVTGSDRPKTIQQVGEYIAHKCKRVYQCSGNQVWEKDLIIRENTAEMPRSLTNFLTRKLNESEFPPATAKRIEARTGCWNVSVVGRGCSDEDRTRYIAWDFATNERANLVEEINNHFPNWRAAIGGETGIDIFPKGFDKAQILYDFDLQDEVRFFGDQTDIGGNDREIFFKVEEEFPNGKSYTVTSWKDTWKILKGL